MDTWERPTEVDASERSRDRRARALFEGIDDAVFVHDLEGRILDANPAACRRLGYSREELLRLTTSAIDDPEFATGFAQRLQTQLATGRLTCEGRHVTKDGRLIPVEINTSAIQIDGKPAVLAVMRDISVRKAAERRLAAQYAVTRVLAESATVEEAALQILQALGEGLGWDLGILWIVDRPAQLLQCVAVWHRPELDIRDLEAVTRQLSFAPGAGLPGIVWASNQLLWREDLAADTDLPRASLLHQLGFRGVLAVPIQSGNEAGGVVEFFNPSLEQPDEDLRSMLTSIGIQVGQFLERKRFEQALRESEAFYHSLVESLPQNIIRKDREGRFTFVNQRVCAELGRPLQEIVGKTDYDLFPPELADKYRKDDQQVLESGSVLETVEEHRTPDGKKLYVQIIKSPIYDFQGQSIGTQVIFWDVTERKRWEEALSESERRYRQLTEASQDAIVVADQEGKITLFNPAAERIFGYTGSEILGKPLSILMPEAYRQRHRKGFRRFLETRQPRVIGKLVELHGLHKDGTEFPLELSLNAIDLGGELQFLGAIRDTTERERLRRSLEQSEKLASIGQLSAGVAHEINNPLAYVSNNLAVLDRDIHGIMALVDVYESARDRLAAVDPAACRRAQALAEDMDLAYVRENFSRVLARTREGVQRVTRIVQSLRTFARTDTPQVEETNLPDLIDTTLEMIRGQLKRRGIAVKLSYGPTMIRCVPTQLGQVLLNLFVNASQAIEAKGAAHGGTIRLSTRQAGDELCIEMADDGCGIDPKDLPRLFDPFFTTKPVGEGTGLGLSITHGIVKAHSGRVEVESQPGQGSRFQIFLPLEPSPTGG